MRIPSLTRIVNRALDWRGDAVQAHDDSTVRQIDTLIRDLYRGMKARWSIDGSLIVTSATTPSRAYRVTAQSCDCPAFVPCKHMRLRDLLIEMAETEAETADMLALAAH